MRTLNKIKIAIAALFVGLLGMAPLASFSQNENGVTDQGESTTKVNGSYVNENGKFVCWPRVSPNGKLLTYGPVVTTDSVNSITSTTATLYGNVVHDGWCGVTEQGFEVSTDANFTTIVATVVMNPHPSFPPCIYPACLCAGNEYHKEVTGLTAGTHYYYRAYAENPCDPDPSYGDTLEFDTPGAGYVVEVTGPSPVQFCPGGSQSATYTASVTPAMTSPTYQWFLDGTAVTGETSSTYTTTFSVTGTHAVKCEITEGGPTVDGTKSVTVSNYAVPSFAVSGDASICVGATGNLTATTGFDSYAWSSNVASSSTNTATYTAAGTYTVTATTSDGCTATATKTVTVTDPNLAGTFSASSANICSGDNASLTATYTGSYSGTLSYQWYQGFGASKIALSGKTSSTLDLTAPVTAGDYTCVLTHTLNGCSSTMEAVGSITVNTVSVAITSLTAAANPVCSGESTTVTPTMGSYSSTLSYAWSTGASGTGVPGAITTGALTSNTTYKLTVTATTGSCSVTATKSITITVTNTSATTNNVASVTCVSATLSGSNTACSDARGFVYSSTNSTPTVGGTGCTNISVTNGTGSFTNALSGLTPNTTYHVRAYSHSADGYVYGTVRNFTTSAINVNVVAQNGTISDSHQDDSGTGAGAYSVTIAPASATTTYHYRAYATNSRGTTYGEDHTFVLRACAGQTSIVIDGDAYTLHEVGSQCWTSNLHVTHYADGVAIPRGCPEHDQVGNNVYANLALPEADIEAYYYEPYNVNPGQHLDDWSVRINSWGRLYNWAAATRRQSGNQVQGICPNGWHVPTYDDWNRLMSGRKPYDVCKPERWPENTTTGTPGRGVYDYNHGGYTGNSTHFSIDAAGYIIPGANDLSALNIAVNYWCGDKAIYPWDIWFQHDANVMGAQGDVDFRAFGFYVRCVKN